MDVKERIERICKKRNTRYSDFRRTIYYDSFLDLISKSQKNISDEDIIENAKEYSISSLKRNKNISSEDLYLFEKIFKSKNEVIVELIMSIIAVVDNIEYFPHEVLLSVYHMSVQDITSHSKKAYEHFYDEVINRLELWSANYGIEKWGIPHIDELVENLSIRSNAYKRYMQVLDEASEPHYTDFATIVSPFVKTPSYAQDNNKMGVLCVLKGSEYAILDPHTNDVNYTIISGAEEAGIRPKYRFNSKKPPKNEGYVSKDSNITEFGYWPIHAVSVSEQMDLDVDHKKRLVGSITTGISFINGKPIRKLADCYEYKGEIYTLVPAEFINGMGGDQILSNNGSYRNGDPIWTKFEPLKCYVDKKTKNIITTDIIMSGIDAGLLGIYFDDYFTNELHQFDVFYQCKRRNLEKKPIPFSNDRIRLINLINQMIDNPGMSVDDESFYIAKEKNNNVASSEIKKDNTSKLDEAIDAYIAFDKDNIDTSKIDDYVRVFKAIIEQLKLQEDINEETIACLQELIQPLDELTDPNKRIERILNGGGAGEKLASDEKARQKVKELIPKTDQIVKILCQKYRTDYYTHSATGSETAQLIDERNRFESLISTVKDNDDIDELSYIILDSLNRLIALCCNFVEEDKIKELLQDKSKPLENMLDVNNRIVSLVGSEDIVGFINAENNNFIKEVLDIYNVLNPILDVIYENNNIETESVSGIKNEPNNSSILGGVVGFISGFNPFKEREKEAPSGPVDNSQDVINKPKMSTSIIEKSSIEDILSILKIYSSAKKQRDLINLKELLECGDYSFDIGKINNLVFIVLKNQNDDTTYVYTNNHLGGIHKFEFDGKRISWERSYWEGEIKHTLNIAKRMDRIPSQKQVRYTIKRFMSGVSSEEIVRQEKYDEKNNSVSVEDEESTDIFTYDINEHGLWRLRNHEASNIFIEAIHHDIEYYVSSDMMSVIKFFSTKIAQQIQNSDRLFEDEDEEIPK